MQLTYAILRVFELDEDIIQFLLRCVVWPTKEDINTVERCLKMRSTYITDLANNPTLRHQVGMQLMSSSERSPSTNERNYLKG